MSRGQGKSEQELLTEVINDWLENEDEKLGDAFEHMITPEQVITRAQRYNQVIRLANEDWLQLNVRCELYTSKDLEAMLDGAEE